MTLIENYLQSLRSSLDAEITINYNDVTVKHSAKRLLAFMLSGFFLVRGIFTIDTVLGTERTLVDGLFSLAIFGVLYLYGYKTK